LFQGGFEVFHDFLGENVGIGKIVGFLQRFVSARKVEIRKDPFIPLQRLT
jgi:hypothetical protein